MIQLLLAIIYLSFISLGLPDSLLGSAWPSMYKSLNAPISYAGIISMIIAFATIISSLANTKIAQKFETGKITLVSVAMTAVALFGFSISNSVFMLCLWAIPYGLGAGSVDSSLNNYVAVHYKSAQMSWLHCMWGVGASLGPYIMGLALAGNGNWNAGYRHISIIQIILTLVLLLSLPLWKLNQAKTDEIKNAEKKTYSISQLLQTKGVKEIMLMFFCYSALEQTTGLWTSSYLTLYKGISSQTAASFASFFYIGITIGRGLSGFLTLKFNDRQMIFLGLGVIIFGILFLVLPSIQVLSLVGLILIGLGCAPIFPSIIHSTPANFGTEKSAAIIGLQMASSYSGTCLMPPLFGVLAQNISSAILPFYLLFFWALILFMHKKSIKVFSTNK